MPRYFFNLRRGPGADKLTSDPDGDELAGKYLVGPRALEIIRGMMKTRSHSVRDWMACSLEITVEHQRPVMTVSFGAIVVDQDEKDQG